MNLHAAVFKLISSTTLYYVQALVDHVATNAPSDRLTLSNGKSLPAWPVAASQSSSSSQKLVLPPGITPLHAAASIGELLLYTYAVSCD